MASGRSVGSRRRSLLQKQCRSATLYRLGAIMRPSTRITTVGMDALLKRGLTCIAVDQVQLGNLGFMLCLLSRFFIAYCLCSWRHRHRHMTILLIMDFWFILGTAHVLRSDPLFFCPLPLPLSSFMSPHRISQVRKAFAIKIHHQTSTPNLRPL